MFVENCGRVRGQQVSQLSVTAVNQHSHTVDIKAPISLQILLMEQWLLEELAAIGGTLRYFSLKPWSLLIVIKVLT